MSSPSPITDSLSAFDPSNRKTILMPSTTAFSFQSILLHVSPQLPLSCHLTSQNHRHMCIYHNYGLWPILSSPHLSSTSCFVLLLEWTCRNEMDLGLISFPFKTCEWLLVILEGSLKLKQRENSFYPVAAALRAACPTYFSHCAVMSLPSVLCAFGSRACLPHLCSSPSVPRPLPQ